VQGLTLLPCGDQASLLAEPRSSGFTLLIAVFWNWPREHLRGQGGTDRCRFESSSVRLAHDSFPLTVGHLPRATLLIGGALPCLGDRQQPQANAEACATPLQIPPC